MFLVSLGAVLALSLYTGLILRGYMDDQERAFVERISRQAVSLALMVTGEELSAFTAADDVQLPEYAALKGRLAEFGARIGALYVYYFRIEDGGRIRYIIDNDFDERTRVGLDTETVDVAEETGAEATWERGEIVCEGIGIYVEGWEGLSSAYAPVRRADGGIEAVAGVDVDDRVLRLSNSRMTLFLSIQILAVLLVSACGLASILSSRGAARRAEAAMRAKSSFLARMSHEIRTPMAAVVGMAELAQREYGTPKALERIDGVAKAGAGLIAVIDDILDISKVEQGAVTLKPGRYSTAALLADSAAVARVRIGERRVELEVKASPDLPGALYGDAGRVKQILLNLLHNAVKFTPQGRVSLTVSSIPLQHGASDAAAVRRASTGSGGGKPPAPPDAHDVGEEASEPLESVLLTFLVEDTGVGIRPADLKGIFKEYSRADSSGARAVEGTGLGLSIARSLARAMGGDITAESEFGKGTTFTARIVQKAVDSRPMGELDAAPAVTRPVTKVSFTAPEAAVLVVDDLPSNLIVAEGLLAPYQALVSTASSGREAVLALERGDFDLVFLDHMMPGMDGIETVQAIRAMEEDRFSTLPVVAFTANALAGMREFFLENGFDDFMAKPIDVGELDRIMRKWIPASKKAAPPPARGADAAA
jgi:signal transduction histidine kinase/CheY-like chemotaxis protein